MYPYPSRPQVNRSETLVLFAISRNEFTSVAEVHRLMLSIPESYKHKYPYVWQLVRNLQRRGLVRHQGYFKVTAKGKTVINHLMKELEEIGMMVRPPQ